MNENINGSQVHGTADVPSTSDYDLSTPPRKKRRHFIGDFAGDLTELSREELCHIVKLSRDLLHKKNQKIKLLKQQGRRQEKKIHSLTSLVEHLTNENLASPEAATSIMVHSSFSGC